MYFDLWLTYDTDDIQFIQWPVTSMREGPPYDLSLKVQDHDDLDYQGTHETREYYSD